MKKIDKSAISYFFLGIGLILAYQVVLPLLYFSLFHSFATSSNFWISNLTYIFYYVLVFLGLILLFHKSLKEEWILFWKNKKSFSKESFKAWGKGFLLMILSNMIVLSVTGFEGTMAGNEVQNRELLVAMPLYAISIMCIFGPFIEEMIFRKAFRKAFKNRNTFAFVTSFLFASLHVINGFDSFSLQAILENWTQLLFLLPYSALAIFFAYSYYDTKSIFTSVLAHTFHNTLTVIAILGMGSLV